ncbi:hypothetical protein CLV30_103175 [Haloactinopolyspora alba]|uniref:Uncharacterized protein n=1 Tax=Haloactinopolyspora alba TaxID=648780 RepID=A0A2P8E969_9ACTN|nr:hypothetical protein CLV30_103175 [Haloactinopolyspora alba]
MKDEKKHHGEQPTQNAVQEAMDRRDNGGETSR